MPFELGVDFGSRHFGEPPLSDKIFLVLEEEPYRYQAAISDLAGFDIQSHGGNYAKAVKKVRDWIAAQEGIEQLEANQVIAEYEVFDSWYYDMRISEGASLEDILSSSVAESMRAMRKWLGEGRPRG